MIVNGIIIENREFDAFTGNLPPGWEKFLAEYPEVAGMVRKKVEWIMAGDLSSEDGESKWPRIELDVSKMDKQRLSCATFSLVPYKYVPWGILKKQEQLVAGIFRWLSYSSDPFINEPDIPRKPRGPKKSLNLKELSIPQAEAPLLGFGHERSLIIRHSR